MKSFLFMCAIVGFCLSLACPALAQAELFLGVGNDTPQFVSTVVIEQSPRAFYAAELTPVQAPVCENCQIQAPTKVVVQAPMACANTVVVADAKVAYRRGVFRGGVLRSGRLRGAIAFPFRLFRRGC